MSEHPIKRSSTSYGTGYRANLNYSPPIYQPEAREVHLSPKKIAGIGLVVAAVIALFASQLLPQSTPPAQVVIKDGMAPSAIENAANNLGLGSKVLVALGCEIELKNPPLADIGLAMRKRPVIDGGAPRLPSGKSVRVIHPLKVSPAHSGDTWIGYERPDFGNPIDALLSLLTFTPPGQIAWSLMGGDNILNYMSAGEVCYRNATPVIVDRQDPSGQLYSGKYPIGTSIIR